VGPVDAVISCAGEAAFGGLTEETRYDGIVLSVHRHDVGAGVELMKDLRASAPPGEGAVILVGRSSFDRDPSSLLDAGFDDVMRMPFAKSALLDVVGRHVSVW
jgi:DNA-binding response OmpR family regulator